MWLRHLNTCYMQQLLHASTCRFQGLPWGPPSNPHALLASMQRVEQTTQQEETPEGDQVEVREVREVTEVTKRVAVVRPGRGRRRARGEAAEQVRPAGHLRPVAIPMAGCSLIG